MAGALAVASGRGPGGASGPGPGPPGGAGGAGPAEGTVAGRTTKRLQNPHLCNDSPGMTYRAPWGWQMHLPGIASC